MAIVKKPAPEFLAEEIKKPKGLFRKPSDLDLEYERDADLRKKATDSVYETSHLETRTRQIGRDDYEDYTVTIIDHKLTDFGKQYIFENDQLYWQIPEKFRTESMRAEMAIYRPDLLYVEGFELSNDNLIKTVLGPTPEGLSSKQIEQIENTRRRLLADGILKQLDKDVKTFDMVLKYCRDKKDIPSEVRQWLREVDQERDITLHRLTGYTKDLIRGRHYQPVEEYYKEICKDFKLIYPEKDLQALEQKIWVKNLDGDRIPSPFVTEKLKELGIGESSVSIARDLKTVCDRIKDFTIKNNLALEFKDNRELEIESINKRSLAIYDGRMAVITLSTKSNAQISFSVALGREIGFAEGHVHTIANLSEKQFNTWMLDAVKRATERTLDYPYGTQCTSFFVDKKLEKEELPLNIHPAITIQERRRDEPNIMTADERKEISSARTLERNMSDLYHRGYGDSEVERYDREKD